MRALGCALAAAACAPEAAPAPVCPAMASDAWSYPDVQAMGTHNSYHLRPPALLDASWDYDHPPLDRQLDLGVRAIELDVHLSDDGAFHVFHLPAVDPVSTCDRLEDCLAIVTTWLDAHPCATPVTVWIEPKDDIDAAAVGWQPLDGAIGALDDAVRTALGARAFTPDDLRGDHATLPDAVRAGWPSLGAMRGRVVVSLLDSGDARDELLDGAPALAGRAMFATAGSAEDAWAALFKIDDAPGEAARVAALVDEGFVVTSNVGSAEDDPATNAADLEASLDAGPHHLASDFVDPEGPQPMSLPGGSPRCHPARQPACGPAELEGDGGG